VHAHRQSQFGTPGIGRLHSHPKAQAAKLIDDVLACPIIRWTAHRPGADRAGEHLNVGAGVLEGKFRVAGAGAAGGGEREKEGAEVDDERRRPLHAPETNTNSYQLTAHSFQLSAVSSEERIADS
jgi:hypothetical protein